METPTYRLADDGALDFEAYGIAFHGFYPAIDGQPLRAVAVTVERQEHASKACWRLADGSDVELTVTEHATQLHLQLRLLGVERAPQRIEVLQGGIISGAPRAWTIPRGIGGGNGIIDLPAGTPQESHACTAALIPAGPALGIWCEDLARLTCSMWWQADSIRCGIDTEGIAAVDGEVLLPLLRVAGDSDGWALVTAITADIGRAMGVRARPQHRLLCSWYYYFHHFSRADLDRMLAGLCALPDRGGITTVQIDAGNCTSLGDWLEPNHLWPGGLKEAFHAIRAAGFTPGLWLGPFMVGSRSQLAREHPDWLMHARDGSVLTAWRYYGEHRLWHYADEEYYHLDTSHPEAIAYLRHVVATLVQWGLGYLKTDFIYFGLFNPADIRPAQPGRTSVEYLRDAMTAIREELGPERYLLGCIAPYAPCLGLVDGMRVGGDVGAQWSEGINPQNMLEATQGALPLDQRWFHTDPDAMLVRDFHTHLTPDEVQTLALWQAITGSNLCTSDPLDRCAPDRQLLWRFCDTSACPEAARIPAFGSRRDEKVAVRGLGEGRWAVVAINTGERPLHIKLSVCELVSQDHAWVHNWGPGIISDLMAAEVDGIEIELPPHTSRIWLLADRQLNHLPRSMSG